ncbi:MAG: DUF2148 domain-containing protein [Dysgonamonadaceae bacterium]|jgi:uncharacterized ferredoxin-like protein|nr:DUF2148 domain-containing protein [Dysgonamonadaceae bacterium]
MILNERCLRNEHLQLVARQMATAARTAPKGKGWDILEIIVVDGNEIVSLSEKMKEIASIKNLNFFIRDAENILLAEAILIIGTRNQNLGLNCGYCGFATCAEKDSHANVTCALNVTDVGIAIGSATATAADWRVDSRVMFSVGLAAKELGWLNGCNAVYGIPISASAKNPFFDRVSTKPLLNT